MYKSKKVNGGVGVKKQSFCTTPIRLNASSRNFGTDYTANSTFNDTSHSKITQFKLSDNDF